MGEQDVVMYDSDAAAVYKTGLAGWVSRDGFYWGEGAQAESAARYRGCTHRPCGSCGQPTLKTWTHCGACREKRRGERYAKLEARPWDGETPLMIWDDDVFFEDEDALLEYCEEQETTPAALRLVICEPVYLRRLDEDYWADNLPEDFVLPASVASRIDALNTALREAGPVVWKPGMTRPVFETAENAEK